METVNFRLYFKVFKQNMKMTDDEDDFEIKF